MKKIILVISLLAILAACGSNGSTGTGKKAGETAAADNTSHPDYQKGLSIISVNDCKLCHRINEQVNGPSYMEIAERYAGADQAMISDLAQKIIKGGTGVWGERIMNAHPTVSPSDAEAMVKYILLLKK